MTMSTVDEMGFEMLDEDMADPFALRPGEVVYFTAGQWRVTNQVLEAVPGNGSLGFYDLAMNPASLADSEAVEEILLKRWVNRDDFAAAYHHACARVGVPQEVVAANLALAPAEASA